MNCTRMVAGWVAGVLPRDEMIMLDRMLIGNSRMRWFVAQRMRLEIARKGTALVSHIPTERKGKPTAMKQQTNWENTNDKWKTK